MTRDFEPLVHQIWKSVEATHDSITGRHIEMPPVTPTDPRANEARFRDDFPVLKYLEAALKLARGHSLAPLAEAIGSASQDFRWSQNASYNDSNCARSFLDGYAYAGLSGPDAPLTWAAPRTGIMLMGPNVLYPGHNHEAREIYMLLTPGAEWRLNNGDWFRPEAGDLIFHDSWQMHEMRTNSLPMLAVAAWIEDGDRASIQWDPVRKGATV